jgi:DNA-binding phage protein
MRTRLNVERLREVTTARGHLKDTQIQQHTKLSGPTISRLFSQTGEPKLSTVRTVARAYDISIEELLMDEDEDAEPAIGAVA